MTWDRDQGANLDRLKGADFEEAVAASAGGEAGLDTREKIVNFTNDEWFILKQGWASVSLNGDHGLKELRSLYEHLQARILEMIETLDDLRASGDYQVFQAAEKDDAVIGQIVSAQREELEQEIAGLETKAARVAEEARELAGEVPF